MRRDSGPKIGAFLGDGSGDGGSLHLALVVDDDSGVVLEVEEGSVFPPEGLPLSDDHGRHHLLPQLGFALLDGGQDHVARGGGGKPIQTAADASDGDDVQVLGACLK